MLSLSDWNRNHCEVTFQVRLKFQVFFVKSIVLWGRFLSLRHELLLALSERNTCACTARDKDNNFLEDPRTCPSFPVAASFEQDEDGVRWFAQVKRCRQQNRPDLQVHQLERDSTQVERSQSTQPSILLSCADCYLCKAGPRSKTFCQSRQKYCGVSER